MEVFANLLLQGQVERRAQDQNLRSQGILIIRVIDVSTMGISSFRNLTRLQLRYSPRVMDGVRL